jgi:hypothetical protein
MTAIASGTENTPIIRSPTAMAPILGHASVIPKTTKAIPTKKARVFLKEASLELSEVETEGFSGVSAIVAVDSLKVKLRVSKVGLE